MKLIKKIGFAVLALILILSVFECMPVSAAAKPKINVQSKTIFVDGSSVRPKFKSTYTYYIKNRPKKYSVTWSSADESIAKVEKLAYSKAQVTAVGVGTTTITADFVDKVTSTKYSLTTKVTVKKNCAAVAVTPATIPELDKDDTIQLTATMYNKDASVCEKDEVTDVVQWTSDNTKVATVSSTGLVTAVGAGKANITCFTTQAASGTYSKIGKATAKKTVEISVKDPAVVGITEVKQISLNKIQVTFGGDYKGNISKENLTITKGGYSVLVKDIEFDATGRVAYLTTYTELENAATYRIAYNNSLVTVGKETSFVASKGEPVRFELYTAAGDNRVIAGKATQILFRLYDANNVDITPLDSQSQEYASVSARFTLKQADNTSTYGSWYVDSASNSVYILDAGKSVAITAEYKYYVTDSTTFQEKTLTGVISVTSVSEASTLAYEAATITNSGKPGSEIDFTTPNLKISVSDLTGFKLVAKVRDASGNYLYTTDADSKLFFSSATSTSCFVKSNGEIIPFAEGSDQVIIYYGDDTKSGIPIGTINIAVTSKRVATSMVFEQNGQRVTTVRVSNQYGVSEENVNVTVYDQFNEVLAINDIGLDSYASNLTASCVSSNNYGPYANCFSNGDGTGRVVINALGMGNSTGSGTSYQMKVTYDDTVYGKFEGYITALVVTPLSTATSTYKAEVSGDFNMRVGSTMDSLPQIKVDLYELKNGVKYSKVTTVKSSPNSSGSIVSDGDYFFRLYKGATEITKGVQTNLITPIYTDSANKLVKYETGVYSVKVYKRSGTNDLFVSSVDLTLTDTTGSVKWDLVTPTTSLTLRDTMTPDELKAVFGECFKVYIGNDTVGTSQITLVDPVASNGSVFFRTATIVENITIGGTSYSLTHTITLNTIVRSK